MKNGLKHQKGQSLVIFAAALVGLIALIALVVDAGNAYVERRKMQNAVDSGSQAGTLAFAQGQKSGIILTAVKEYVGSNGVDPNRVKAHYVYQDSSGNQRVDTALIQTYDPNWYPKVLNVGGVDYPIVGVQVDADKTFDTYFARILGIKQMTVNGISSATASKGACYSGGLFPATISVDTFVDEDSDGNPDVHYEKTDPTYTYRIWENKLNSPGNFGWVNWSNGQQPSEQTLLDNIAHPENSGVWKVNDLVPGTPGSKMTQNMQDSVTTLYINTGKPVTIPIYDVVSGSGNNTTYKIKAFARFHITAINKQGNDKYIEGKFQEWVAPDTQGGCANFGISSTTTHPPLEPKRTLAGTVKINKLTPKAAFTSSSTHVPVDVVNVLDISGSMNDGFGSKTKIQAAKDALKAFNNKMQITNTVPALNDQVALVTYPKITSGSSYNYSCTQSGSTNQYYSAQTRSTLTSNVASVNSIINGLSANGGTPIGAGIQFGRQTVLGTNHQSGRVAVMILASDGLANVRLTNKWTGFQGNTFSSPTCNAGAVQDAIDQANVAKSDGNNDGLPDVIVFSIAVGDNFNPDAMRAIASPDPDPSKPHYFRVTDANSMASIYDQIANRVQAIQSESCEVTQSEAFANTGTVVVKNTTTGNTYTLTTTAGGEFVLPNADAGTYVFQSATVTVNGITYNVFTDSLGGPATTENPSVVVGIGTDTYRTDLFLKTSTTVTCH